MSAKKSKNNGPTLRSIKGNKTHLCNSCQERFPECPAGIGDILFGDSNGNDNDCACSHYRPDWNKGLVLLAQVYRKENERLRKTVVAQANRIAEIGGYE